MDVKSRNGEKFEIILNFLAHPVEPRDRCVQTHATVGYVRDKAFFSFAAYMPLFLTVSEIYGRKVSKW